MRDGHPFGNAPRPHPNGCAGDAKTKQRPRPRTQVRRAVGAADAEPICTDVCMTWRRAARESRWCTLLPILGKSFRKFRAGITKAFGDSGGVPILEQTKRVSDLRTLTSIFVPAGLASGCRRSTVPHACVRACVRACMSARVCMLPWLSVRAHACLGLRSVTLTCAFQDHGLKPPDAITT